MKIKLALSIFCSGLIFLSSADAGLPDINPPDPEPSPIRKSRYISFVPKNSGLITAIRVTLTSLYHPDPMQGNAPDLSAYEGEVRWVGVPSDYIEQDGSGNVFKAAKLECTPQFMDWGSVGLLNVYGSEVVPDSIYHVQAIHFKCDPQAEQCYSASLQVGTARMGDVVIPFYGETETVQPDFSDISAVLNKFKGAPGSIPATLAHLYGVSVEPSELVDFSDISSVVDSFKNFAHGFTGPVGCPPPQNRASSDAVLKGATVAD